MNIIEKFQEKLHHLLELFELQVSEPMPEQKKVRPFDVHPIET
jgi:hypothetical protein